MPSSSSPSSALSSSSSSLLARFFALRADDPRFAHRLVALRDREEGLEPVTAEAFLRRAAAWRATFEASFAETSSGERPRRVFVLTDDTIEGAALLFGAWGAGVETMLGSDALPETLKRLRAGSLLEAGDGIALDAARAWNERERLEDARDLVPFTEPSESSRDATLYANPVLPEKRDLASLFTSGSTGDAKRVAKRLEQLFREVEGVDRALRALPEVAEALKDGRSVAVLATVTHQHIYGILFRLLWPLLSLVREATECTERPECAECSGNDAPMLRETPVLLTSARLHYPEALARTFRRAHALGLETVLVTSPAHLKRLDASLFTPIFTGENPVRRPLAVVSSAGPLDEAGARLSHDAFGRFPLEVLGSTETGGIARRMREFDASGAISTPDWRPMPGVSVLIEDEETGALRSEGTGRVRVSGPQIRSPEGETGADRIELRREPGESGENGENDESGCTSRFRLLGRTDRILKIEGMRVSPADIEAEILATGLARAARVLLDPASSARRRESLAALVELTPEARDVILAHGKSRLAALVKSRLAGRVTPLQTPKRWRFVDAMPVNAQGKCTARSAERCFDSREPEWVTVSDTCDAASNTRTVRLRTRLTDTFAWFEGHFKRVPILPGVAQLVLVERALKARLSEGAGLTTRTVRNLKFKAPTIPGMTMDLVLTIPAEKAGEIALKFAWIRMERKEEGETDEALRGPYVEHPHAQGTIVFGRAGENAASR